MRWACIGELIQIDGCEHRWFEDRAPACTALVSIDYATSRLMQILFTGSESTSGYFDGICANTPAAKGRVERAQRFLERPTMLIDLDVTTRILIQSFRGANSVKSAAI